MQLKNYLKAFWVLFTLQNVQVLEIFKNFRACKTHSAKNEKEQTFFVFDSQMLNHVMLQKLDYEG